MTTNRKVECFQCSEIIDSKDATQAMGLGDLGEFYWCSKCLPPPTRSEEAIGQLERMMNPKKERPADT